MQWLKTYIIGDKKPTNKQIKTQDSILTLFTLLSVALK